MNSSKIIESNADLNDELAIVTDRDNSRKHLIAQDSSSNKDLVWIGICALANKYSVRQKRGCRSLRQCTTESTLKVEETNLRV